MSRRIVDYRLEHVGSEHRGGAQRAVGFADLFDDGWQPLGPPVFDSGDAYQALVKYADEPEDDDGLFAAMVHHAVNAEREAVVEYVRDWCLVRGRASMAATVALRPLADQIEAGAHHEGTP